MLVTFINGLIVWTNEHTILTGVIIKIIAVLMAFTIALWVARFTMAETHLWFLQLISSLYKV
ncbi:hypothetical protein [Bartonella sp. CB169]|uniref:hypothetical protein n=1 Tax=Bartonella sp. CB169 TaxID=3112257 RepID=UPI00300DF771